MHSRASGFPVVILYYTYALPRQPRGAISGLAKDVGGPMQVVMR